MAMWPPAAPPPLPPPPDVLVGPGSLATATLRFGDVCPAAGLATGTLAAATQGHGADALAAAPPAEVPRPLPLFARWQCSGDAVLRAAGPLTGEQVCVQLVWHPSLPSALPERPEEAICEVLLLQQSHDAGPEFYEARLLAVHLQPPLEGWSAERLGRLMAAMAQGRSTPQGAGVVDRVQLRRLAGRLTIDVLFGGGGAAAGGPRWLSSEEKVVDVLNAYPVVSSSRIVASSMLRTVSRVQREHQSKAAEARRGLSALRAELAEMERRWAEAQDEAKRTYRGSLRRFALLLQAKVDKERELVTEADERSRAASAAAAAKAIPAGAPLFGTPVAAERSLPAPAFFAAGASAVAAAPGAAEVAAGLPHLGRRPRAKAKAAGREPGGARGRGRGRGRRPVEPLSDGAVGDRAVGGAAGAPGGRAAMLPEPKRQRLVAAAGTLSLFNPGSSSDDEGARPATGAAVSSSAPLMVAASQSWAAAASQHQAGGRSAAAPAAAARAAAPVTSAAAAVAALTPPTASFFEPAVGRAVPFSEVLQNSLFDSDGD